MLGVSWSLPLNRTLSENYHPLTATRRRRSGRFSGLEFGRRKRSGQQTTITKPTLLWPPHVDSHRSSSRPFAIDLTPHLLPRDYVSRRTVSPLQPSLKLSHFHVVKVESQTSTRNVPVSSDASRLHSLRLNCCDANAPASYKLPAVTSATCSTPSPSRKLTIHLRPCPILEHDNMRFALDSPAA